MSRNVTCESLLPHLVICVGHIYGGDAQVMDEGGVITSCSRQVAHSVQGRQKARSLRKASKDNTAIHSMQCGGHRITLASLIIEQKHPARSNVVILMGNLTHGLKQYGVSIQNSNLLHVFNKKKRHKSVFIILLK